MVNIRSRVGGQGERECGRRVRAASAGAGRAQEPQHGHIDHGQLPVACARTRLAAHVRTRSGPQLRRRARSGRRRQRVRARPGGRWQLHHVPERYDRTREEQQLLLRVQPGADGTAAARHRQKSAQVLLHKYRNKRTRTTFCRCLNKRNCKHNEKIKEYNGSLCGNGIIEAGEECDCGYAGECTDPCCYDANEPEASKRCHLRPNAKCSPSQGPCCSSRCEFEPSDHVCMQANECVLNVTCTGERALCPSLDTRYFRPNHTSCNSGTQVCLAGVCSASICEKFNMTQCYLSGDLSDKRQDKSMLCHLACTGERTNHMCVDSFELPELVLGTSNRNSNNNTTILPQRGLILKPGSPCMGTTGYCDIFSKCRSVDTEGPLLRLKKLLLDAKTLTAVQIWIRVHPILLHI